MTSATSPLHRQRTRLRGFLRRKTETKQRKRQPPRGHYTMCCCTVAARDWWRGSSRLPPPSDGSRFLIGAERTEEVWNDSGTIPKATVGVNWRWFAASWLNGDALVCPIARFNWSSAKETVWKRSSVAVSCTEPHTWAAVTSEGVSSNGHLGRQEHVANTTLKLWMNAQGTSVKLSQRFSTRPRWSCRASNKEHSEEIHRLLLAT